jgi:hypothetical protein
MSGYRIEVDIAELILDGTAPVDVAGLPAAIEEHLTALSSGTALGGSGQSGSGVAFEVARAVFERLPYANAGPHPGVESTAGPR